MTTSDECAQMILDTVPLLMRMMGTTMRQHAFGDEPTSIGHVRMLKLLHERQRTLRELAERYHVAPSTMSRTIDVLVRREWVNRQEDPSDRRQVLLRLTKDGELVYATVQQHAQQSLAQMVENLTDDEREHVYKGLGILQRMIIQANDAHGICPVQHEKRETGDESA